ncbi:uncharacterized protein At4g06744-like [Rutidosis leptorrhynchoides]|uniref:uncharacterized protein At4g06744-like n=1 Tax=Rutidosis leptorrhynchoides TaxID=125765 RepID=UPI003A9967C0
MVGCHTFLLLFCITHFFIINHGAHPTPRQTLEIIIGGGYTPSPPPEPQECPPPPPPPCPPPPSPPPPPPSPPPPSPLPPKRSPPPPPKSLPRPPKSPPRPPKSPPQPPSQFASERLRIVYPVIQAFRKKITSDPYHITDTWKGTDICKYKGFRCDTVPDFNQTAVSGVKFNNFNFYGPDLTITEFLCGLKDIAFFHANSNNFTGSLPPNLAKLRYLFELDLSNNKFMGNFPTQVLGAKKLVFLDLRFNTFSGLVPPQVFNLELDVLFINNNNFFAQKLPENLGSTTALFLTFANNMFIGEIPKSIGQAANTLQEVLFLNNRLSGCLPYEIGLLKKATVFDVGFNDLTGPIPHSFQCLKKMDLLNLADNKFYGPVPEEVCNLPNLSNFTLSYNYFTQVEVKCMELIKKGILDVKMNCILGLKDQRSAADCAKFFSKTHSCPDEKSLKYVPCSPGYESNELESSEIDRNALEPEMAPAEAPVGRSYGALAPH